MGHGGRGLAFTFNHVLIFMSTAPCDLARSDDESCFDFLCFADMLIYILFQLKKRFRAEDDSSA